jgi:hypothetical protein
MSDDDRQQYDEWLDKPDTILGINQGRHDATKFKIISYYWKYSGEWLNYSDDQRFEKAWEWHLQHCNPPRSREEFDRICRWTVDMFRKDRDKTHEEARSKRNNFSGMAGCVSYQINSNPDKFIVSTPYYTLVETIHRWENSNEDPKMKVQKVYNTRTFLCCKPVRIIKHRNPLSFLNKPQKYTMQFAGSEPSGNFTLKQKTLSQIISILKETQALTDKNLDVALIAQIKGFEKSGLLEENDDTEYIGFLPTENNNGIICSNVDISDNINIEELRTALDFIDKLAVMAYKDRLDLLSHVLLFGLIAPCSFIFKCIKAPCLEWIFFYGSPNSTKTSSSKVVLALDGHENDQDYNVNMQHVDTIARMGETISRTTFPKAADEMELIDKYTGKELTNITAAIKSAIDQPVFRKVLDRNRNEDLIPALSPLMMTSNPPPPLHNAALMKRIKVRHFPTSETHLKQNIDAITYDKEILANLWKLRAIGKFRNWFVTNNQAIILDTKLTPFEKARKILVDMYEYATGNDKAVPDWFSLELEQSLLEESLSDTKQAVITAFEDMIIDKVRVLQGTNKFGEYKTIHDRLNDLVSLDLLPFVKRVSSKTDHTPTNIMAFSNGVVAELQKYGVTGEQLPNLDAFANYFKCRLQKSHGKRTARITDAELSDVLNTSIEDTPVKDDEGQTRLGGGYT